MIPTRKSLDALYLGCGWLAALFLAGIGALMLGQAVMRERILRGVSAIYAGNLIFGENRMEVPVAGPVAAKLL